MSLSIPLVGDECGVTSASALVSAADIAPIGPIALDVSGDAITGSIESVPAGSARTVTVSAFNAGDLVVYEGSATVDVIAGQTAMASIALTRNTDNCPIVDTGDDTGTIVVDGTLINGSEIAPLPFRVGDAEYSDALDKIVAVSSSPSALRLIDPTTGAIETVALSLPPLVVSVSPDGLFAAVGHDAWVSYVDLSTLQVVAELPVSVTAVDIVLAGNGFVYVLPREDQWARIHTINLGTGEETLSGGNQIYAGTLAKLHPTQQALYGADNGLSPSDIEKYDISGGNAVVSYDSPYHGDYDVCGDLWITESGDRIYTRCGNTFRADPVRAQDMIYAGSVGDALLWVDHTSVTNVAAMIPGSTDTELRFIDNEFLTDLRVADLPTYTTNGIEYPTHGQFVFFRSDGSEAYVVAEIDPNAGVLNNQVVVTVTAP